MGPTCVRVRVVPTQRCSTLDTTPFRVDNRTVLALNVPEHNPTVDRLHQSLATDWAPP